MRILCVSTLKNKGPFLIEWLAHLMGAGVTDFLLYSNDCKDGTDVMLDVLDRVGVIEHIPQPLIKTKAHSGLRCVMLGNIQSENHVIGQSSVM